MNALGKLKRPFELLLVDDGSSDATPERAKTVASHHSEVIVLRHDSPRGFGASLRTALERAQYPLFFYTSLDYPYQTTDLRRLLERIDEVDLVSGFRAALKPPRWYRNYRRVADVLMRILVGLKRDPLPGWLGGPTHLYARLMRTLLGVQLDDVESAYKLFRREIFDRLPIQSDGPFVHTEIIAKANFQTLWMDEVPIGAQGGVPPAALAIPFSFGERRQDLRRVFSRPDFGKWTPRTQAEPAAVIPLSE